MFKFFENKDPESGFSLALPDSILSVFNDLKAYCDLHGYPQELNINLYRQGGFKHIPPTKQGLNGIKYRFEVRNLLDGVSVSKATSQLLQEKYEDAQRFSTNLSDKLQQTKDKIEHDEKEASSKETAIYEALHENKNSLADQIEEEVLQIRKGVRRAEILLKHGTIQLEDMKPFIWCLELLSASGELGVKREEFKAIEADFDKKLLAFSEEFKAYVESAKQAGLEVRIFKDKFASELTNPFSNMSMRNKVLSALDLTE